VAEWFVDDDAAYEAWLAAHADGYVWALSQGGASVLHRATCRRISGRPPAGRAWTHFYGKACAADRIEMVAWVRARSGSDPVPCRTCLPLGGAGGKAAAAPSQATRAASSPQSHAPLTVSIARMATGPGLVIEDAARLARDFFTLDASSAPGGYDDLAGRGEPDRITSADIVAINTTMRARSSHGAWADLTDHPGPLPWLVDLDPTWDLIALDEETWTRTAQAAMAAAIGATVARGRGLSVATKVLHLKRPGLFPVLDSLVLQQLGVTESVPPTAVIEHLRAEGRRNLAALQAIQAALRPTHERSLVRILDVLLWSSHPAAGIAPALAGWQHVVRRAGV